jgi:hypothetical protein
MERIRERVRHWRIVVAIAGQARVAEGPWTPAEPLAIVEDVVAVTALRNRGNDGVRAQRGRPAASIVPVRRAQRLVGGESGHILGFHSKAPFG